MPAYITEILANKSAKPKEKTEMLSAMLLDKRISVQQLLAFAASAKDLAKATCIEALEFATKQQPEIADEAAFTFVITTLAAKAPRIKWESAKVIGNTASLFPNKLDEAITALLANTTHPGTVVRWSAAFALGEILKLGTVHNKSLLPALEQVCEKEEKNSIRKIYLAAFIKTGK
jgi:HEAT repeat protein